VRQWVLTLPHQLRYVLARDHALCRAVAGVFVHAVLGSLRRRARQDGVSGDRSGAVAIIQRFGAALNLNVHVHALVLDGVYVEDDCGTLRFHAASSPVDQEMDRLLGTIERRIRRLLIRRGVAEDVGEAGLDRWHEEAPVLAGVAAASVQGRRALGERAGARTVRHGASDELPAFASSGRGPCHARSNGYDLHANVCVPARERAQLERLCRYGLRPPVAQDRLRLTRQGQVVLELRHPWTDGTTHLVFDPLERLERLAALTPRPRINLVVYYGVLGARSAWRARLAAHEPAVGRADAAELRVRCPRVFSMREPSRTHRADREPACDPPYPESSRSTRGSARGPSGAVAAPADRGIRSTVRRRAGRALSAEVHEAGGSDSGTGCVRAMRSGVSPARSV
jgi:Putative transposase